MFHYTRKDDQLKGMIQLDNTKLFSVVEKNGKPKELLFNIKTQSKNLLLRAVTKEEKDMWCSVLESQIPSQTAPIERTTSNSIEVEVSLDGMKMSGYLTKKDLATNSSWKKYFVVLVKKGLLFREEKEKVPSRIIPLEKSEIFTYCEKRGIAQPLLFNLRHGGNDFLLQAATKDEKEAWCNAIKEYLSVNSNSKEKYDVPQSLPGSPIGTTERKKANKDKD